MPIGNPPALPDTGAGAPPQTSPKSNSASAEADWYAAYLRMNGQNAGKAYIQPQDNWLWQDTGTITNDRIKQIPEPAYYDTKTGTAYRYPGIFLSGLTLGLDKVDTRRMNPIAKATYYAGRVAGAAGLGYGLGVVGGSLLGASSRATAVAGRIAEFGSRHPTIVSATRGAMKGLLIGSEAAKGIVMKSEGYGWSDVVGTIGSDFAGLYAFERGLSSGFISARKNVVRKRFAKKNSRFYAGETYKGSHIIKDDPSQVRLTRTLRNNEMVLEFKPKRPHPPKSIPKYDIAKLPQEVPTNDAFITGTINTKSKPFTTFKAETPKTSDYIKPPKDTKLIDLSDELKFLKSEKDLPPQLYTEREIVTKVLNSGKVGGSTVSAGSGTKQVLKTDAITITKLNIGRTRLDEAARVANIKSGYMRMMKDTMPKIKGLGDSISRAARDAFGGVMGALSGVNPVSSASASSHTTSASSTFFNTGAGFSGMETNNKQESGQLDFSTGTEYYYWTGVSDIYSEYPMTRSNNSSDTKTNQAPKEEKTDDQTDTTDTFNFLPLTPHLQQPHHDIAQKQDVSQKQEPKITPSLATPLMLGTVKPPSYKPTKLMPPIPFKLSFSPKYGRSSGGVSVTKRWSRKNQWGDIRFSLDSLKRNLANAKLSLKINPTREKPKPLSKRERKTKRLKRKLKRKAKMARVAPKKKGGRRR